MENFILRKDKAVIKVPLSSIYYVTTHPTKAHTAVFVTREGNFEATMPLSEVEEKSEQRLIRCHRKFLVNQSKIVGFDHETRTILFMDEKVPDISCSRRYFTVLKEEWKKES